MSLAGSMFTGVSGLKAQGQKIGIISDNIANVNTVGYKAGQANFSTLVANASNFAAYTPGGVLASNRPLVDKQGILQTTDNPMDIAVAGEGFFIVKKTADGPEGEIRYTRAGSFRQDATGNFVNPNGYYLQGWPLDADGRLPGQPGNMNTAPFTELDSLKTVNVEASSGVASATTQVAISANLQSSQQVFPGAGETAIMDINNSDNYGIDQDAIIVPDAAGAVNSIVAGDQFTVATGNGLSYTYTYGGFVTSRDAVTGGASPGGGTGNIWNASSSTDPFFDAATIPTNGNEEFTITTTDGHSLTLSYTSNSPQVTQGQFNNLSSLANAIDASEFFTARVVGDQLYVAPTSTTIGSTLGDNNAGMTFTNGGLTHDWITELGLANTAAGSNRFATLQGLAALVNGSTGLTAVIENPTAETTVEIRVDDPLDTITFTDEATNTGSLLAEFGMVTSLAGGAFAAGTAGPTGPAYDASGVTASNMASGDVQSHFNRNIRVYDALGTGHDLKVSFLKIADNTWAVEMFAANEEDVSSGLPDDQLAVGTVVFNGDGSLRSVSTDLTNDINVNWLNGAAANVISFNWGTAGQPVGTLGATTIGLTDGLRQYDADYLVNFINQNGTAAGSLINVTVDDAGFLIANYDNGDSRQLYKLPLAEFSNYNGLTAESGNVYAQSQASGALSLREPGTNGTGDIASASLEQSNVELAEELTNMIIAQKAYQASARVISTTDELLDTLDRL